MSLRKLAWIALRPVSWKPWQSRLGHIQAARIHISTGRLSTKRKSRDCRTATHTGNAADVKLAVEAGTNSVEHGSVVDAIPDEVFAAMKAHGIAFDPTLSVVEGYAAMNQRERQIF